MSIQNCKLIELPKIADHRGNLTFIENSRHIPFDMKRIYYLYDVPDNAERGAHGHRELQQLIVALSGSFEIILNDGCDSKTFYLNKPWEGLYIPPMMWRELKNFSSDAICFVLASHYYDEKDYFRDYEEFLLASKSINIIN